MYRIKCDKCGSLNVSDEHVIKELPPITMDEYIKKRQGESEGMVISRGYTEYRKLVCRDCWYTREFSILRHTFTTWSGGDI